MFGQSHFAGLDAKILSLERQLADLQVASRDEDDDAMEIDDRVVPTVDQPPSPGVQDAEDSSADGEEDAEG